jgi:hypothetical protein
MRAGIIPVNKNTKTQTVISKSTDLNENNADSGVPKIFSIAGLRTSISSEAKTTDKNR